jgi:hypothetical protein
MVSSGRQKQVLVGTVRAIKDGRAVVRTPDGRGFLFTIKGRMPSLGENVVGKVDPVRRNGLMTLDLSERQGLKSSTISFFGDPEIFSRIFKRVYTGAAAYAPGRGDTLDRLRLTGDADLDWALTVFGPEADREGVALNVLDVRALAAASWANDRIEDLLPSDTCRDPDSTEALLTSLRSGFAPTTRMILETSLSSQESVDFVLPYSPLSGGWNFTRREAMAARRMWPNVTIDAASARRLSAARQMAMVFASRVMPKTILTDDDDLVRTVSRRRLVDAFSTAAASLAWLRAGGDRSALEVWSRAKKASGAMLSEAPDAEQRAVILCGMTAAAIDRVLAGDRGRPLLKEAAVVAAATCAQTEDPNNRIRMIELAAEGEKARADMFVDCDEVASDEKERRRAIWRADLDDIIAHLGRDTVALSRLATTGRSSAPLGRCLDDFDDRMLELGLDIEPAFADGLEIQSPGLPS